MNTDKVLAKLLEIERSLGKADIPSLRGMVLTVQEEVVQLERRFLATLTENCRLREQLEKCERSSRTIRAAELAEALVVIK